MANTPPAVNDEARQVVVDLLRSYGLEGLADWIMKNVREGADVATIYSQLRQTEEYKKRFPAMADLMDKAAHHGGRAYTERDYLDIENSYREILSTSGLPPQLWDSADDYAELMRKEVSAIEVKNRVDAARDAVLATDAATREEMLRLYGITSTDLMAYALVPDRGADYIRQVATTSIMAGMGASAGLAGLNRPQWEDYARIAIQGGTGYDEIRGLISQAGSLAETQTRLASLEGDTFTAANALDISVKQDVAESLDAQRRAARERARFAGSTGVSSGSLRGQGL